MAWLFLSSFAMPEAATHLMVQKFVMGYPLYQQEQELKRQGIPLSRQTMSNWLLWAAEHLLTPVYDQLHKQLLKRDELHANETTLQVLHEPGKIAQSSSYLWLYRTSGDTDRPIVLYDYQPGRGACCPKAFLKDFKGYLHTDGYSIYHDLPQEVTVVGCWAHARRKFDEAMKSLPKGKAKDSSAYLKNQWPFLLNYLKDGRLELSNNRAERSIKEPLKNSRSRGKQGGEEKEPAEIDRFPTHFFDDRRFLRSVSEKGFKNPVSCYPQSSPGHRQDIEVRAGKHGIQPVFVSMYRVQSMALSLTLGNLPERRV